MQGLGEGSIAMSLVDALQKWADNLEAQISMMQTEVTSLKTSNSQVKETVSELAAENSKLKEEIGRLSVDWSETKGKIETIQVYRNKKMDLISVNMKKRGCRGRVVTASGWKSRGSGFELNLSTPCNL